MCSLHDICTSGGYSSTMARIPLLLAIGLLELPLSGCSDVCANTPVREVAAPDGRHKAVLFQRDCGATTGFSTQVSVLESGDTLTGSGNVFVADTDHGAAEVAPWGGPTAELTWLAADHLLISYAAKARLFTQEREQDGVRVSYRVVAAS